MCLYVCAFLYICIFLHIFLYISVHIDLLCVPVHAYLCLSASVCVLLLTAIIRWRRVPGNPEWKRQDDRTRLYGSSSAAAEQQHQEQLDIAPDPGEEPSA